MPLENFEPEDDGKDEGEAEGAVVLVVLELPRLRQII